MNTNLSKTERKKIYREMLNAFESADIYTNNGFCIWLMERKRDKIRIEQFPELMEQKPKTYYRDSDRVYTGYWWSPSNRKKRIEALKRAIELAS